MVSDDERREVAERLMDEVGCGSSWPGMERLGLILGIEREPRTGWEGRILTRLADLIDPCDMLYVTYSRSTCGPDGMAYMVKVRHRARGLERDFYAVDLKKLLEVLDEMDITVKCAGPDVPRDYVENWANEVREALGANYG